MVACTLICCSKAAPKLLVHVSLLLVIIAGAGVATLARLKWDPSTYLIFRGLLPNVYSVLSGVLCFASFMLIALAHLAVVVIGISNPKYQRWRRTLLFVYAALMLLLILVELGTVLWLAMKFIEWIRSGVPGKILDASIQLLEMGSQATAVGTKVVNAGRTVLNAGGRVVGAGKRAIDKGRQFLRIRRKRQIRLPLIFEIIDSINNSWAEIIFDIPFNIGVAVAFIAAAAILQPLAALLALNAAYTPTEADYAQKEVSQTTKVERYFCYKNSKKLDVDNKTEKTKP